MYAKSTLTSNECFLWPRVDLSGAISQIQNPRGAVQSFTGAVQNSMGAVQNSTGAVQNSMEKKPKRNTRNKNKATPPEPRRFGTRQRKSVERLDK